VSEFQSKLTNCDIYTKEGETEPLFYQDAEGRILCNLDGYAIVPRDMWREANRISGISQKEWERRKERLKA